MRFYWYSCLLSVLSALLTAQSNGNSITGTVVDPSGAAVPLATVEIHNPVSGLDRSTITNETGSFSFANIPFNPYHLSVTARASLPMHKTSRFAPRCLLKFED